MLLFLLVYLTIGFILFSYRRAEVVRAGKQTYLSAWILELAWCLMLWPMAIATGHTVLPRKESDKEPDIIRVGMYSMRNPKKK